MFANQRESTEIGVRLSLFSKGIPLNRLFLLHVERRSKEIARGYKFIISSLSRVLTGTIYFKFSSSSKYNFVEEYFLLRLIELKFEHFKFKN